MSVRVAINGFGRVGRCFLRAAHDHEAEVEIVAVNDLTDAAALAQLLKYDSVFGRFPGLVTAEEDALTIDGHRVLALAQREPAALPWADLGVDVVIESTGRYRTRAAAVALGVNFDTAYDPERHHIISNASCTTNCLAPVAKVLHETVGIRHGLMTTIH